MMTNRILRALRIVAPASGVFIALTLLHGCSTDGAPRSDGDAVELPEIPETTDAGGEPEPPADMPAEESLDADGEGENDPDDARDAPPEDETPSQRLRITFIDNNQFIMEFGGVVVYTDVFMPVPEGAPAPDLIKISHDHSDHFDPVLVAGLASGSGAMVLGPSAVTDALSGLVPPEQIVEMSPATGGREGPVTAAGTAVTAYGESTGMGHGWSHMLEAEGFRVFDAGCSSMDDFISLAGAYAELYDIDAAFLAWYDRAGFVSMVHPSITVMMHLSGYCEIYIGDSDTPINLASYASHEF